MDERLATVVTYLLFVLPVLYVLLGIYCLWRGYYIEALLSFGVTTLYIYCYLILSVCAGLQKAIDASRGVDELEGEEEYAEDVISMPRHTLLNPGDVLPSVELAESGENDDVRKRVLQDVHACYI